MGRPLASLTKSWRRSLQAANKRTNQIFANSLNERGQVAGATCGDAYHAVLFDGGAMIDLGTLEGYDGSFAKAINDCGQTVGYVTDRDRSDRAVMWTR